MNRIAIAATAVLGCLACGAPTRSSPASAPPRSSVLETAPAPPTDKPPPADKPPATDKPPPQPPDKPPPPPDEPPPPPDTPAPPVKPAPTDKPSIDDLLSSALAQPKGGASPPGTGGSDRPFDRGQALRAFRAVRLDSCVKAGGPKGSGHVTVAFAPDGTVASAEVDQPPFAGTSAGTCIADRYRKMRVPPFTGKPMIVGMPFTLGDVDGR